MLYLKNSLVNLTIVLISLFFITISLADKNSFIFPKKKIITIKTDKKKVLEFNTSKSFKSSVLPQRNPLRKNIFLPKKIEVKNTFKKKEVKNKVVGKNLPLKKPIIQNNIKVQKTNKPYLESVTKEKIDQIKEERKIKKTKQVLNLNSPFLYPSKKPLTYSSASNKAELKSKILKDKDYNLAKNIFSLIKKGKWNTAVEQTKKVKDKEFKSLVTWLHLKQNGNQATFNDYKNFIDRNSNYPRIGRLRYMAEHKIILENTSPKTVINWFDDSEPLSGTGKIKLGEAYLKIEKLH